MNLVLLNSHVVSAHGLFADPQKIEVIHNIPTPKKVGEVRSFLGMVISFDLKNIVNGFYTYWLQRQKQ